MGAESCPRCRKELPREARFCAYCGATIVAAARPKHREERRVITALFADLAGSTQLGEKLDPEDFRDLTGGALAVMGAAIEALGGTVRGTAGDGVLGLFGAPTAHEDDAERAVLAGLRLVQEMGAYAGEAAARYDLTQLHVRVGIETGLAVLGEVRAGSQAQYDASGDCLNTAARLEGAASVDGVLVGPVTHRLVSEVFEWGDPCPLALKGKAAPVVARHALSSRVGGAPRSRDREVSTRLVGRDHELAIAVEVVAEVSATRFRTVFITGQAGIGKTRFLRELRSLFVSAGDHAVTPSWFEASCLSYGQDDPYLPFQQILRQALGPGLGSAYDVRAAVSMLVGPRRVDDVAAMVGLVLGLSPDEDDASRVAGLSAELLQQAVIDACAELMTALAARGPVAVALDDLHWSDPASLRLLEGLISALADDLPIMMVLAARPETDAAAWGLRERVLERHPHSTSDLGLTSLDRDAERWLISSLVGEGTVPDELEAILLRRAEGNPFYLRELVRSLQDSGALVETDGRWSFDHDVPVEVPETVGRVVLARIDRLAPDDRDLLNTAAVIGREFDVPLLARVAGARVSPTSLSTLTRLGLFEATGTQYRFSHPLIQETAYSSMLRRGRADLHARAAAAIEALAADGAVPQHAVLAHHHAAAGQVADAVKYHRLAAIAAERVAAIDEALRQLDLAITAAGTLDPESSRARLPELHLMRGRTRGRHGDYDGGSDDFRHALAGARLIHDREIEMQSLTDLGWLIRVHSYDEAIDHHQQALRIAEDLDSSSTQVTALSRMSTMSLNRLQLDGGLAMSRRALEIARATGRDPLLGTALDCLKFAALQLGQLTLLEQTVAEILKVHERTGDHLLRMWAFLEGATAPLARGDLDGARAWLDKAAEINDSLAPARISRALILEASSWIERAAGDLDAAVAAMRAALDVVGDQNTPEWAAWLEASLGSHLIEQGNVPEAIAVLESAMEHAEAIQSPNRAFRAASHLAWARRLVGDDAGSREALGRAQQVRATISAPPGSVFLDGYHSYLAIARTCAAMGEVREAKDVLLPLLAAARRDGWRGAELAAGELLSALESDASGLVSGSDASVLPDPPP